MATYYIATTGSNTNNGTSAATPFATFAKANSVVVAGDTVNVADGTYNETPVLNKSGTSTSRIVWQSTNRWGAKINAVADSGTGNNACVELSGAYQDFLGFDVSPGSSTTNRVGLHSSSPVGFNCFRRCHVHDISRTVVDAAGGNGGSGVLLDYFTGSNSPPFASNCEVTECVIHDIGYGTTVTSLCFAVYVSQANAIVENNIIYRCGGWGVQTWHAGTAMVCSNNLIFSHRGGGIVIGTGDAPLPTTSVPSANCKTNNNEIIDCPTGIHIFGNVGTGNTWTDNLIWNCTTPVSSSVTSGVTGTITADPLMVNYQAAPGPWTTPLVNSTADYHLTSGSPARNAGTTSNAPTIDYEGTTR